MIDNFHFCTQQKILKYAKPDERSEERKKHNAEVITNAKELIVAMEKRKYREKYDEIIQAREAAYQNAITKKA